MADRPILFSAPMVRALLAGTKTQMRRLLKCNDAIAGVGDVRQWAERLAANDCYGRTITDADIERKAAQLAGRIHPLIREDGSLISLACPYGRPGDRLWVRETWGIDQADNGGDRHWHRFVYRADPGAQPLDNGTPVPWKPSIHMPRAASRITLEITEVRVQRLQDIREDDARAEGAPAYEEGIDAPPPDNSSEWSYRASFRRLWESINGPGSWDANPWLWCISFRRTDAS